MRKYLDVHGKKVHIKGGKKLGFIDNAIFNYKSNKITSYILSDGGVFPKVYMLPLKKVYYDKESIFTKDYPTKYKKRLLKKCYKYTLEGILQREIINEDKKIIGEVEDVIYNEETGKVRALICKRGFFDDLIGGKKIMLLNSNLVILPDKIVSFKGSIEIISEISFKDEFEEE